ncbi:MAG: ABC transporter, substrate-binding protein (cluster 1, maltose/g3p/polyamine/iron) [uncultured Nocardioidaceae bacterium]|uniref:ABC transporter, substrate-binding protein (Cluster 1, maltose/g3p/polyamine/iron) n=1 Tax=uncultured Nocardioidaceae bacterium TaxID=253824 RepID=A0A6J4L768_9ACTN|nr:MAG: ABC transporter, substrate-binding protein (cluster 1, maltose/g3p/polyamine/iron) [uncultured Nocardioidaceae bacterium]
MNRRLTPALAVLAAGALLGACAQGTSNDETSEDNSYSPDAELTGELNVLGFGGEDEIGQTRLDEAKSALGDAKVKLVEGDLDIQQFLSSLATGEPPEIIYANRNQVGTFAAKGAIMPLTDCIEGEGIDTGAFRETALAEVTFNDEVYAIPEFNVVQIIQANNDLLQAEGLTVEDINGTDWDAVTAANQALTRTKGGKLSVIGFDSKLPEFLPLWAKANGADLISEDARTAQIDDPAVVEALEFAVEIYDAQGGFSKVKAYRDSADFFGEENQFAVDSLGAMPMEQWYVNVVNEVSPDVPMAFDTVRTLEGDPIAYATGSAWAIPTDSPNPEAACRFAKVMTATESWVKAAEARVALREEDGGLFTGLLTGNTEADEQIREMVKPSGDETWDAAIEKTYEANDNTFSMPANPAGEEFETAWQDAVNRVLNGQQEPAAAMAQAQEEAQAALDKAWSALDEG